jgi:hypothetical protein
MITIGIVYLIQVFFTYCWLVTLKEAEKDEYMTHDELLCYALVWPLVLAKLIFVAFEILAKSDKAAMEERIRDISREEIENAIRELDEELQKKAGSKKFR